MVGERLDSGGGDGGSGGDSGGGGGGVDLPDSVYDDIGSDPPDDGGGGGGVDLPDSVYDDIGSDPPDDGGGGGGSDPTDALPDGVGEVVDDVPDSPDDVTGGGGGGSDPTDALPGGVGEVVDDVPDSPDDVTGGGGSGSAPTPEPEPAPDPDFGGQAPGGVDTSEGLPGTGEARDRPAPGTDAFDERVQDSLDGGPRGINVEFGGDSDVAPIEDVPEPRLQPSRQRQREAVADQFERDPDRVFSGTERIPVGVDDPTADDIRFADGQPRFTDDFRGEVREANIEREAARFAASTPGVRAGDDVFQRTESGLRLTDSALAGAARGQAAEADPLRDEDEFVADVERVDGEREVDVRPRADPFFSEQREAFGEATDLPGLPGLPGEPLTTEDGESTIRRGLQRGSSAFSEAAGDGFLPGGDPADPAGVAEDVGAESGLFDFGEDIERGGAAVFNLPGAALGAATVAEQGADLGQAEAATRADVFGSGFADTDGVAPIEPLNEPTTRPELFDFAVPDDSAAAEERAATGAAATQAAEQTVETATERPGMIFGGAIAGGALSVGSGVALGRGLRGARGRVRTAGGTRIDADDIVNPSTRRFAEGGDGDPFPPVRNQELAERDPAAAIRQQADEFTPGELEEGFADRGAPVGSDESVMFRAVDTEPEGPETGRAARGLETFGTERPFDPPGGFVGPELSPRFLGVEPRSFSLRPGLPDTGGRPTAVAVRTRVREADAGTEAGFRNELRAREGETDAFTRPEFSMGEAEAVVPPGAEFADIGGGPVRNTLRRAGIGSDFYTEVAGQRVPLRTVAAADDTADGGGVFGRFLGDDRGQLGAGDAGDAPAFRGSLDELSRAASQPVDRPSPVVGAGAPASSPFDAPDVNGSTAPPEAPAAEPRAASDPFGTRGFETPTSTPPAGDAGATTPTSEPPARSGGVSGFESAPASSPASSRPADSAPPSQPGPSAPPSEAPPSAGPPSGVPSPFGPPGLFGSSPPPAPDGSAPAPSTPPFRPFGPPTGSSRGRPRDDDFDPVTPDDPPPLFDDVAPETPEFRNPIASGVEDIFGADF